MGVPTVALKAAMQRLIAASASDFNLMNSTKTKREYSSATEGCEGFKTAATKFKHSIKPKDAANLNHFIAAARFPCL
jgi:hypothetical protein